MIRRLNYTGRIKIQRGDLKFSTQETSGAFRFDAKLHLIDYDLPADALVFVEAYRQTTWMRFPFGTVANLQPPENLALSEFETIEHIKFRVKVTQAQDEHVLLAVADRIPLALPDENADRESLLPVHPAELGDELWQVDLQDEPCLRVNKSATADWRQLAQSPLFVALVYPAVLRQILGHILDEGYRDTDDELEWRSKWLRFATLLPGVDPDIPATDEGDDAARRWAEDAVAAFAKKLALKAKFAEAWQQPKGSQ